jgi:hypothetical protein
MGKACRCRRHAVSGEFALVTTDFRRVASRDGYITIVSPSSLQSLGPAEPTALSWTL